MTYLQSLRAFYSNTGQVRIFHHVECVSQVSVHSIEHVRTKRTVTENDRTVQRHLNKKQRAIILSIQRSRHQGFFCMFQRWLNFQDFVDTRISILKKWSPRILINNFKFIQIATCMYMFTSSEYRITVLCCTRIPVLLNVNSIKKTINSKKRDEQKRIRHNVG